MCSPTAAFVGMSVMSAGAQVMQGRAAKQAGEHQARHFENQKIAIQNQTMRNQRLRMEEFAEIESANTMAAAFAGLDPRSIRHVTKGNRRRMSDDVGQIVSSGAARQADAGQRAESARLRGRTAMFKGLVGAATTLGSAGFNLYNAAPPSATSMISFSRTEE